MSESSGSPKNPKVGPAAPGALQPEERAKPSAVPTPNAPVVLVVDDDADIRTMLVRALGTKYTIYEARDGLDAREILERMPVPDAIVCDVMMPRLDGFAFAKLVRKEDKLQRIPFLFLTARGSPIDVVSGINAGARHYVTKPFKIADVMMKVTAMITKK